MISDLNFHPAGAGQENPPVADLPAEAPPTTTTGEGADAAGGLTCRIMDHAQGSDEWKAARRAIFTASEVPLSLVEDPECRMNVTDIKGVLDAMGISYAAKAKKDELVNLLPDKEQYFTVTETARKARAGLIRRKAGLQTAEGIARDEHKNAMLDRNFDILRGRELEPIARALYGKIMDCEAVEVGLCVHNDSAFDLFGMPLDGFGCSPDGLIAGANDQWIRGLEIKAPSPEKLQEWIDDGKLPDEHSAQVHMSMAVTGLREWDFAAYCPGMPFLIVRTAWDRTTDRFLEELRKLHADYVTYRSKQDASKVIRIGFGKEDA